MACCPRSYQLFAAAQLFYFYSATLALTYACIAVTQVTGLQNRGMSKFDWEVFGHSRELREG